MFFSNEIFARFLSKLLAPVEFVDRGKDRFLFFASPSIVRFEPSWTNRVPRKRTQDDGWQSGRERFVRISKSRKCGNANNPPKDRESFLKGQTSLLGASVKVSETTTRSAHRADLIPTPVGVIIDSSHVYIDHRIFPSESRTKQFPYS